MATYVKSRKVPRRKLCPVLGQYLRGEVRQEAGALSSTDTAHSWGWGTDTNGGPELILRQTVSQLEGT